MTSVRRLPGLDAASMAMLGQRVQDAAQSWEQESLRQCVGLADLERRFGALERERMKPPRIELGSELRRELDAIPLRCSELLQEALEAQHASADAALKALEARLLRKFVERPADTLELLERPSASSSTLEQAVATLLERALGQDSAVAALRESIDAHEQDMAELRSAGASAQQQCEETSATVQELAGLMLQAREHRSQEALAVEQLRGEIHELREHWSQGALAMEQLHGDIHELREHSRPPTRSQEALAVELRGDVCKLSKDMLAMEQLHGDIRELREVLGEVGTEAARARGLELRLGRAEARLSEASVSLRDLQDVVRERSCGEERLESLASLRSADARLGQQARREAGQALMDILVENRDELKSIRGGLRTAESAPTRATGREASAASLPSARLAPGVARGDAKGS